MTLESQEEARSLKVSLSLFQSLDFILKAVARVRAGRGWSVLLRSSKKEIRCVF